MTESEAPPKEIRQVSAGSGKTWVFAVQSRMTGGHAKGLFVLVDSGSDEHVCPKNFAPSARVERYAGEPLRDA